MPSFQRHVELISEGSVKQVLPLGTNLACPSRSIPIHCRGRLHHAILRLAYVILGPLYLTADMAYSLHLPSHHREDSQVADVLI